MRLASHASFVLGDLVVCDAIEGILGVGRLVHLCVVLVVALDDALGRSAHQHHMVSGGRDVGVRDTVRLVPRHSLQDVRLGASRDQIRTTVLLDLWVSG